MIHVYIVVDYVPIKIDTYIIYIYILYVLYRYVFFIYVLENKYTCILVVENNQRNLEQP